MSTERQVVVGWDLDDCLAPTLPVVASLYKRRFGHDIDLVNACNGQPEPWGVDTFAEAISRYEAIMEMPGFHQLLIPDTDTLRAVHALDQQGIPQVVVTGRADQFHDASAQWLSRQFPGVQLGLVTTNHHTSNGGVSVTKGEVCAAEGITHMLDDAPVHLATLDPDLTTGFLMERPWNAGTEMPHIVRVTSPLHFARECLCHVYQRV
ncbi:MAG: hypothetical protein WBB39_00605 [Candidatus Saccharimonadales bacterium]